MNKLFFLTLVLLLTLSTEMLMAAVKVYNQCEHAQTNFSLGPLVSNNYDYKRCYMKNGGYVQSIPWNGNPYTFPEKYLKSNCNYALSGGSELVPSYFSCCVEKDDTVYIIQSKSDFYACDCRIGSANGQSCNCSPDCETAATHKKHHNQDETQEPSHPLPAHRGK